jgi:hypothetical protein
MAVSAFQKYERTENRVLERRGLNKLGARSGESQRAAKIRGVCNWKPGRGLNCCGTARGGGDKR